MLEPTTETLEKIQLLIICTIAIRVTVTMTSIYRIIYKCYNNNVNRQCLHFRDIVDPNTSTKAEYSTWSWQRNGDVNLYLPFVNHRNLLTCFDYYTGNYLIYLLKLFAFFLFDYVLTPIFFFTFVVFDDFHFLFNGLIVIKLTRYTEVYNKLLIRNVLVCCTRLCNIFSL